ncbi:hypothetical protein TDSAC_1439 [Thermodesulfobium acidiphilum]|uniref:Uncharacterized protein n=1 Tax=Thermodesulfobium acidiphilum TaxID=1794699 RepID=A0A2R4W1W5_THEAF|nr:hypothetical protein TDSAC_1439 [Thermodesulfobium acidiphilum]
MKYTKLLYKAKPLKISILFRECHYLGICIVIWLAVFSSNSALQAAQLCGIDSTNSTKICLILGDNTSLVSVSWSGRS